MSTPPPIPATSQRRTGRILLIACACVSTIILLVLLFDFLDREGFLSFGPGTTHYYYEEDLKALNLPSWDGTNAVPLTAEQAVAAAREYLRARHPDSDSWKADSIDLRKADSTWIYDIIMTYRGAGGRNMTLVKVLLDGSIWEPSPKRRQLN